MSKLPPEFVKAPAAASAVSVTVPAPAASTASLTAPSAPPAAASRARRTRKASLVAEPPPDPREVLLRLTDEEHAALEDARQALVRAGETVTIAQIIHRVIAEWSLRTKLAPTPEAAQPVRDESLIDRLRAFAASPLRTWRELGATLRRLSGLPAR